MANKVESTLEKGDGRVRKHEESEKSEDDS